MMKRDLLNKYGAWCQARWRSAQRSVSTAMSGGHFPQSTLSAVIEDEDEGAYEAFANFSTRNAIDSDSGTETKETVPEAPKYEKLAQKRPKFLDYPSITLGGPIIIFFDLIVPCIIYYTWWGINRNRWKKDCQATINSGAPCSRPYPEFDQDILGYSIVSFGFGELWILIARVVRLFRYRDQCAPLLSRSKWELDATCWVYAVAMIVALIPFVVGSTLVIPKLYLYGPAFLMGFLGVLMIATLIPFPIPVGINSHARGTALRPFIYYAAEDFIAVDCLQDREFRTRYNERYESSKSFRRLFIFLTLWWLCGVCVYLGCLSAVIWTLEFHYAFGLSFGILFSYILIWAAVTYFWVQAEMAREKKEMENASKC